MASAAGAGEDRDPCRRVRIEGPEGRGQGCRRLVVDGVTDVRTIDRDDCHGAVGLDQNLVRRGRCHLCTSEIGRASCRERVCQYVWIWVAAVLLNKKTQ